MLICSVKKAELSLTVVNSIAVITRVTIKISRVDIFMENISEIKLVAILGSNLNFKPAKNRRQKNILFKLDFI